LTTEKLCNVKKNEFQRVIKIANVRGVTKSTTKDNWEFVVHVRDEYDYRFICQVRDELFECLKQVYYLATGKNLPVFGVDGKLSNYATSKKDVQQAKERMPEEQYRLHDEDVYDEHNQQSAKNIKTKPVNDVDDGKQMEEAAKTMFAKNGNMAVTL